MSIQGQARGGVLFQDDFGDGDADDWTVVRDTSRTPDWLVTEGGFEQLNDTAGYIQSFYTGSYAYYNEGFGLTDYRLSVDITPAALGSVGVMFRYADKDNYYRLLINRNQGFVQLQRRLFGSFSTLAFSGRSPELHRTHNIEILVDGLAIFVYLDDEPLFSVTDGRLKSGTVALFAADEARFDDLVIKTIVPTPRLIISRPASYSVETSNTLEVDALVAGALAGGGVRFTLDERQAFTDFDPPFAAAFSSAAVGDHVIAAVIVDDAGKPLPGPLARDTNVAVGAGGIYIVAFGDSITNAYKDDLAGDDESRDGRNLSRGYAPVLNDLLSHRLRRPVTVVNEGIGGAESGRGPANGLSRVASTIARHPQALYWLVLFGTNDSHGSLPVPSGRGLQSGDPGYRGSYKHNLQRIITSLKDSGRIPIVAKVPFISHAPWIRDRLIQDYNRALDEVIAANDLAEPPPDFYAYFRWHPGELDDSVHPNGRGYRAMANLWFDALMASGVLNQRMYAHGETAQ